MIDEIRKTDFEWASNEDRSNDAWPWFVAAFKGHRSTSKEEARSAYYWFRYGWRSRKEAL